MEKLILHPTDLCQWYALLNEAQADTRIVLCETIESYLVFLLMRFSFNTQKLMDSVVALDYLNSMHHTGQLQLEGLKAVGDKSLLFCGLFPGVAAKRGVSVDYFVSMGQAAYLTLSERYVSTESTLYSKLSGEFKNMQKILQSLSD